MRYAPSGLPERAVDGLPGPGGVPGLFPGGPLLEATGSLDPVSGQRTSGLPLPWPWAPLNWAFPTQDPISYPQWDQATSFPMDPEPWDAGIAWTRPLDLLVSLGVLPEERTLPWGSRDPTGPLPWLPASLEGQVPLGPDPWDWPINMDPVTSVFLRSAIPPGVPVDAGALVAALLADDLARMPAPLPSLPYPIQLTQKAR